MDTTTKLHRVPIRCFDLDPQAGTGLFLNPYYESEVGIGFSGQCFEAMSIIALAQQTLGTLVDFERKKSKPEHEGIANLVRELSDRFFQTHNHADRQGIDLIIYGYCPLTGEPKASHLQHRASHLTTVRPLALTGNNIHVIGTAGGERDLEDTTNDLLRRIEKHRTAMKVRTFEDAFEFRLEESRHEDAKANSIHNSVLEIVFSERFGDVGGVLQKLEAFRDADKTALQYTIDSRPNIFEGLPAVNAQGLGPVPTTQNFKNSSVPNIKVD